MVKLRGNKRNSKVWRLLTVAKDETNGITLIVLVITIIVLLILARSKYSYINWGEFYFKKNNRGKK